MSENECELTVKTRGAKIDTDTIFEKIGGFGKFQVFIYILICLPIVFIASCNYSYFFITSDMDYRCFIPECESDHLNYTKQWITKAVPTVDDRLSKCQRFVALSMNASDDSICSWSFNQSNLVECESFVYLTNEHMLLNEFNLTCANEWKLNIVASFGNVAECIAMPFIGLIADKYGRRPTVIWSLVMVSIFGIVKSFTTNYMNYMIIHFVGALFGGGVFSVLFVYGSEIVGPRNRALGVGITASTFSAAQILLAIVTMFITDFRVLLRFLFGLAASTLTFIWLIPESPRWLFSQNNAEKYEEGKKILKKITKLNKTEMCIDALTEHSNNHLLLSSGEECNNERQYTDQSVWKSKVLGRLINCFYCYFANSLIFVGLSVYSSSLPGNKHMNLMYTGMIEIPGNIAAHYVLKRWGRKWSLSISMLTCSVACIASEFTSDPLTKIFFFLFGKFSVCLSYTIASIYIIELFPTNIRQCMFNICMAFAGFGNIMAPLLPLSKHLAPSLPLILLGGTSFTSALLVLLLPETRHKSMPDSVDEAMSI